MKTDQDFFLMDQGNKSTTHLHSMVYPNACGHARRLRGLIGDCA
jgi:hypothetical protein